MPIILCEDNLIQPCIICVFFHRGLMLGTELQAECLLLEPVTLKTNINRNLSASWYHGHPDVEISGKLEKFAVSVSLY